jgi:hypothetical protein
MLVFIAPRDTKRQTARDPPFRQRRTSGQEKKRQLAARYELEYRPYGQNNFSRCGRNRYGFEVSD